MDITHLLLNALYLGEDKIIFFLNFELKLVKIFLLQNYILSNQVIQSKTVNSLIFFCHFRI